MVDGVTEAVTRQYEQFPYPPPDPDWDKFFEFGDPSAYSSLLWPEGPPRKDLRIPFAGCGTVQAARCAIRNPDCYVLGVDLSDTAIAEHNRLKRERSLDNLESASPIFGSCRAKSALSISSLVPACCTILSGQKKGCSHLPPCWTIAER